MPSPAAYRASRLYFSTSLCWPLNAAMVRASDSAVPATPPALA